VVSSARVMIGKTSLERAERQPHGPRRRLGAAGAALLGLWAMAVGLGCERLQRFPVCHADAECAEREGGKDAPVCFNLKCVACRYDTDCKAGEVCSSASRCDRIADGAPPPEASGPAEPAQAGSGEPAPGGAAEPAQADREACVARCKDSAACLAGCGD
jgi:Cys-rich repeat protein